MKIELKEIQIRDIVEGYFDDGEDGVVAYNDMLDVRPPYQRDFVYDDKKREALIHSVMKGFPINVMYWFKNGDRYEILDGQQRTISICQYFDGEFAVKRGKEVLEFHNLTNGEMDQILDYKLLVYICEGTDKQKLDWFETINIAGEKLTDQELLNAIYTGAWLTDAKRHFSKTNGPAYGLGSKLLKGEPKRQAYLETTIKWINKDVAEYMSIHQHDEDAKELWDYYTRVIKWVGKRFPTYRKEMKGLAWGEFYNNYRDVEINPDDVTELMKDEEVTKRSGIYHYLLSGDSKYLSIRAFTDADKRVMYENQEGICPTCGEHFEIEEMDADHVDAWSKGGKTKLENGVMLCKKDNRSKGAN